MEVEGVDERDGFATVAQTRRLAFGSVVLLCLLCYSHSLQNGFVNFDDTDRRLLNNPFINQPWQWSFIPQAFSQATAGYYDPVYVLSYVIDYQLWGMNPAGFHFGNLVLHTLNSVLVLVLLAALTRNWKTAWLAALLFAVHPVHVESVSWATSRKDTLSLFFGLAAFWVYWKWRLAALRAFAAACAGSVVLLLLGMMVKPTVVCIPAMIFCADLLFSRRPHLWSRIGSYQFLSHGAGGILVWATYSMSVISGAQSGKMWTTWTGIQQLNLFFALPAYFIKIILFPFNLCARYVLPPPADTLLSPVLLVVLPGLLALGVWWAWGFKRFWADPERIESLAPVLWGVAVFFLGILPFTNLLPRSIYVADRYVYIASIGICLGLSHLLWRIRPEAVKRTAMVTLVLLYGVLTVYRVPVWKDGVTLWTDSLKKMNVKQETRHKIMVKAYMIQGQFTKAAEEYEKGGFHLQKDPDLLIRMAKINILASRLDAARNILNNLETRCPEFLLPLSIGISLDIANQAYEAAQGKLDRHRDRFTEEEWSLYREFMALKKANPQDRLITMHYKLNESIEERIAAERSMLIEECRQRL